LAKELDHRVLLPTDHPMIHVRSGSGEVKVTSDDRRWVFPASDCLVLPIPSTTTELLARYLARQLLDRLASRFGERQLRVRVELGEGNGFSAACEISLANPDDSSSRL